MILFFLAIPSKQFRIELKLTLPRVPESFATLSVNKASISSNTIIEPGGILDTNLIKVESLIFPEKLTILSSLLKIDAIIVNIEVLPVPGSP